MIWQARCRIFLGTTSTPLLASLPPAAAPQETDLPNEHDAACGVGALDTRLCKCCASVVQVNHGRGQERWGYLFTGTVLLMAWTALHGGGREACWCLTTCKRVQGCRLAPGAAKKEKQSVQRAALKGGLGRGNRLAKRCGNESKQAGWGMKDRECSKGRDADGCRHHTPHAQRR